MFPQARVATEWWQHTFSLMAPRAICPIRSSPHFPLYADAAGSAGCAALFSDYKDAPSKALLIRRRLIKDEFTQRRSAYLRELSLIRDAAFVVVETAASIPSRVALFFPLFGRFLRG